MGKGFEADYGATKPQQASGFADIPKGTKVLMVVKKATGAKSGQGNPYVTINLEVYAGEYAGAKINFHNVTFLPKDHKYAGIALHVLKCLLQPYEGKFSVNPDAWVGKFVYVTAGVETRPYKDQETDFNTVARIDVVPPRELQMLGVPDDEIPKWLWDAQAEIDKKTPGNDLKKAAAPGGARKLPERETPQPKPDSVCEVCERKFADHKDVKHEFSEAIPF